MLTNIHYKEEARQKMFDGVNKLADAVVCTLGAKGRNVAIRHEVSGKVKLTKDGVTVSEAINLTDKLEDMGAQIVKEAAKKTHSLAGDGTTTSILLAREMISQGMEALKTGANPIDLKRGIDKAVAAAVDYIRKQSIPITNEKLVHIATISANNDPEIGELVADVMNKVGRDGVVSQEESKSAETRTEVVEGIKLDKGYISHYFVTNKEKMTVELDNPLILIYQRKISSLQEIEKTLGIAVSKKRPLLIICDDIDSVALATLLVNVVQGNQKWAAIKLPGYGNVQDQLLHDIAVITGGTVISETVGKELEKINEKDFGSAKKIVINQHNTTIFGGGGKKSDITKHIETIRALISNTENAYEIEKYKQRLAKLTGGVGIIYVGAATQVEAKEKMDRVDDAVRATKAAIEEGILPGGGVSYLRLATCISEITGDNIHQTDGINIVRKSLTKPLEQMLRNAGIFDDGIIKGIQSIEYAVSRDIDPSYLGYNLKTNEFEDLVLSGVIDPAKVARVALENAASVAGVFLTTDCALVDTVLK